MIKVGIARMGCRWPIETMRCQRQLVIESSLICFLYIWTAKLVGFRIISNCCNHDFTLLRRWLLIIHRFHFEKVHSWFFNISASTLHVLFEIVIFLYNFWVWALTWVWWLNWSFLLLFLQVLIGLSCNVFLKFWGLIPALCKRDSLVKEDVADVLVLLFISLLLQFV